MLDALDNISLIVLCDFAKVALSELRDPNLAINLFFSFVYWIFIITYSDVKLKRVNKNADQT